MGSLQQGAVIVTVGDAVVSSDNPFKYQVILSLGFRLRCMRDCLQKNVCWTENVVGRSSEKILSDTDNGIWRTYWNENTSACDAGIHRKTAHKAWNPRKTSDVNTYLALVSNHFHCAYVKQSDASRRKKKSVSATADHWLPLIVKFLDEADRYFRLRWHTASPLRNSLLVDLESNSRIIVDRDLPVCV